MLDTETFIYKYMPSIMLDPREGEKKEVWFLSPRSSHSIQGESKRSLIQNDSQEDSIEHNGNTGKRRKNIDLGMGEL